MDQNQEQIQWHKRARKFQRRCLTGIVVSLVAIVFLSHLATQTTGFIRFFNLAMVIWQLYFIASYCISCQEVSVLIRSRYKGNK